MREDTIDKAVLLYHRAGNLAKAIELVFSVSSDSPMLGTPIPLLFLNLRLLGSDFSRVLHLCNLDLEMSMLNHCKIVFSVFEIYVSNVILN